MTHRRERTAQSIQLPLLEAAYRTGDSWGISLTSSKD
jgi:hypothetical protein